MESNPVVCDQTIELGNHSFLVHMMKWLTISGHETQSEDMKTVA